MHHIASHEKLMNCGYAASEVIRYKLWDFYKGHYNKSMEVIQLSRGRNGLYNEGPRRPLRADCN